MAIDRRTIARKSGAIGLAFQIVNILLSFATRKMFLVVLGTDYLGLNSTLSQLLGALSISELGIQTVIIYRLYRPVAENNHEAICDIMTVYKSLYRCIAAVIAVGALTILPFLRFIITNVSIPTHEIYTCWLIMALTSSLSYLLSYNNALLFADQKQYRVSFLDLIINFIFALVNLWFLYVYHNIYIYFIVQLLRTITSNIMLLVLRKTYYKWFAFRKPSKELVKSVLADTKDMFAGKLAGYVFNSTDNVIISSFIGTAVVGAVGNYVTIVTAAKAIVFSIVGPIQNLAGNFLAIDDQKDRTKFLKNFTYITFVIVSFVLIPIAVSINDFVVFFYGKVYQLDPSIIYLVVLDAYTALGQISVGCMVDASGLFKEQKKFYVVGMLINITLSVVGANVLGVNGVIIGTIAGNLYHWYKRAYYAYKKVVNAGKDGLLDYFAIIAKQFLLFVSEWIVLTFFYNEIFTHISISVLGAKVLIAITSVLIGHCVCYGRSDEFKYMLKLIKKEP